MMPTKLLTVIYIIFAEEGGIHRIDFDTEKENHALIELRAEKVFHEDEVKEFLATNPEHLNIDMALVARETQKEKKVIYQFGNIQIPIEEEKIMLSKRHLVANTVSLEKMLLSVKELIVSPTRMRIDVSFAIEEGYNFTAFENPHLKDTNGNIYKAEGLVSTHISLVERSMFFVPSIYFDDFEKVYFSFDGIWVGAEAEESFTLDINDNYPKTIDYMGEKIVIEKVSYNNKKTIGTDGSRQAPSENLVVEIRMPENIKIQGLEIDGVHSSHGFSSGLDEDGNPRLQFFVLDVEYKSEYEVKFQYAGRFMESKQDMKINIK